MLMRGSRLIPILVTSSLLFTSIAYACSGLKSMEMSFASTAMDNSAMERDPCNNHKHDICRFVRDQMLSVLPSSPLEDIAFHISTIVQAAHFEMSLLRNLLPTGPPGVVFYPVLKFSFPFSSQVLRI
jgi:hypothetical protein